MEFQFLGTGSASQVPCYGCDCIACVRAKAINDFRRGPCSVKIKTDKGIILIDAGLPNLAELFSPDDLQTILLTHYHMDHVQGLFHLRWGKNCNISVIGPDDPKGCDDLYKHSGILNFLPSPTLFKEFTINGLNITPVPLNHSKPCIGYYINDKTHCVAYLTDTLGLPEKTEKFLKMVEPKVLVIDCSYPPSAHPKNHNSLTEALEIINTLQPKTAYLTHIGHELDCFLLNENYQLPANVFIARDNQTIMADDTQE
jgi:phosphoribosyl 1,2-cyclic phosphate phosphodiesterase